jgi:hypothetical protein
LLNAETIRALWTRWAPILVSAAVFLWALFLLWRDVPPRWLWQLGVLAALAQLVLVVIMEVRRRKPPPR